MKSIKTEDIANISGSSVQDVEMQLDKFSASDLNYRFLTEAEEKQTILKVHDQLEQPELAVSGKNDSTRWEVGWEEILQSLEENPFRPELLRPQYFKYDILRLQNKFIKASNIDFEYNFFSLLRKIILKKFLSPYSQIIEFGCGTGGNLYALRNLFPKASLTGCDWTKSSLKILDIISQNVCKKIEGKRFNMLTLEGKENIKLNQDTAIITIHSMEQLGSSFLPILDYLVSQKPGLVFHLEPILELYDSENPLDTLAIKYHKKKNYLNGYLPTLEELEQKKYIQIIEKRRFYFGNLFEEQYSLVIWKPKR